MIIFEKDSTKNANAIFEVFEQLGFNELQICIITKYLGKEFELHDCGYSKSPSTTRTLNDYQKVFKDFTLTYRGE